MPHFLEYSINFLDFPPRLNCTDRINKTTQFLKHSKHESNSFYSIFIKGNVTIISFSIFPVIFKHFHLLFSIHFNSIHMFTHTENSSRGLTASFFFPKSFKIFPSTRLKTCFERVIWKSPFVLRSDRAPQHPGESNHIPVVLSVWGARAPKSWKSIVLHVINKKIALWQLQFGRINIFLCNSHF